MNVRQLDVGVFQHLLQAVGEATALFDQALPIAGQLTQFPLLAVRDETALQQAMLHEGGQPLGILQVRLAPWHALDRLGVDQENLETPFQDVVDRLPVHARALHRHVRHAALGQPISHRLQVSRHGGVLAQFLGDVALLVDRQTADADELLVDVESSAIRIHDLDHDLTPEVV